MPKKSRAAKKTEALRKTLWPELNRSHLWNRLEDDGFTSIPRTMPIVLSIIDDMTKGKPASAPYLELWCRAFDEMYVSLGAASMLALHSGYTKQRATRMWLERIELLSDLGFILTKEGSSGKFSHALILNPHLVIKNHYENKKGGIMREKYDALVERATEIGSLDFLPDEE